ncbi:cobalt-precorrin-5B (C(1))-methyltransferase [Peteryoungia ipomoeae]|uniref:Cobalt-precorrin-5B C(1)-methyltransferase n=1 Tax=Peteryoungia ipomoeae TaxID=1210932 RepID=A0A4S8P6G6_9HYPH|nr:cobalt-precorrin-5B (C(1))-methyltransferase [Peteryoungia ipomoeae]THV25850.1 cobalt-precorrin-5B (C(1))-methyltransferase [Peteryoungia ipomoeae]
MRDVENPDSKTGQPERIDKPEGAPLRKGWTTGACATAATKAALSALFTGDFPDPVSITLPRGETPAFALAHHDLGGDFATAGIVKDAGDDPDVTHGATVVSTVRRGPPGSGLVFRAGDGVGTVTRAGLPIGVGEPAINPVPRQMMRDVVETVCHASGVSPDIEVTISVPGGAALAAQTWNPRLGIVGGLSILGTTGIVNPFSCAAWIHSIHRGIDVARAAGLTHVLGATGSTSEKAAQALYDLPEIALLDMGDFAGGLLKYLRQHPVARLTIAGGFAKLTKLAQGALDLHSSRSQVDLGFLADLPVCRELEEPVLNLIRSSNTSLEAFSIARENGVNLAPSVAREALRIVREILRDAPITVDIVITDRAGKIIAHEH